MTLPDPEDVERIGEALADRLVDSGATDPFVTGSGDGEITARFTPTAEAYDEFLAWLDQPDTPLPQLTVAAQRHEYYRKLAEAADEATATIRTEASRPHEHPTLTVPEAAEMLGISAWQAYELIKRDEFPAPVLRLGRAIRIPRRPLEKVLGIDSNG